MSRPLERAARARAAAFVAPALLWTLLAFAAPFAVMAGLSLWRREGTELVPAWDFGNYRAFLERPHFVEALANSVEIALLVTVISLLLAYPMAWILAEKVPPRWRRVALAAAILPFWTSYVVRSYAWSLVLAERGVLNEALLGIGLLSEPLAISASRAATVTGFVHFFTMLMTLTIFASLVQIPPNLRRAAADLGAGPWATFRHVVLPLSVPGMAVGAFLTFVLCIGDYVTPQILGQGNELVLPQVIMLQLGRRADLPMAAALSILLMIVITLAYLASARWLRMEGR